MQEKSVYIESLGDEYLKHFIGHGCCADCFMINDSEVFKMMRFPSNYDSVYKNSKYISDTFVFPKKLVFSKKDNSYLGYIMDYVNGVTIRNLEGNTNIYDYIRAIKKVEEDIAKMSNYKVDLVDISPNNVMYTKDSSIKIIDTDFYNHDVNSNKLYSHNIHRLNKSVTEPIFDIYEYRFMNDKIKQETRKLIETKILVSDYINMLCEEIDKRDLEVNNIDDCKKGLRLLRR